MDNDTLHGFRIRMAVFARMVNEMIVAELASDERLGETSEHATELALIAYESASR